jgi:tetratricopeptide (TPR) repeat protein
VLRKSDVPSFKETLGWIDYLREDYASATGLLEQAAAALPNRPLVRYHLGMSYINGGQMGKASEQLKKALELTPDEGLEKKIREANRRPKKYSKPLVGLSSRYTDYCSHQQDLEI